MQAAWLSDSVYTLGSCESRRRSLSAPRMPLLTEVAAAAAAANSGATDWTAYVGVPAAIAAIVGLLFYGVGALRPMAVKKARYWHQANTTHFSCVVKNRSALMDRSLTRVSIIRVPHALQRARHPRWRRRPQQAELIPAGAVFARLTKESMKLSRRDSVAIDGELLKDGRSGVFEVDRRLRIQAHAGEKRSRSRRLRRQATPADGGG